MEDRHTIPPEVALELYRMAKRWNGKKMSHGKKNLPRPVKKAKGAKSKK